MRRCRRRKASGVEGGVGGADVATVLWRWEPPPRLRLTCLLRWRVRKDSRKRYRCTVVLRPPRPFCLRHGSLLGLGMVVGCRRRRHRKCPHVPPRRGSLPPRSSPPRWHTLRLLPSTFLFVWSRTIPPSFFVFRLFRSVPFSPRIQSGVLLLDFNRKTLPQTFEEVACLG